VERTKTPDGREKMSIPPGVLDAWAGLLERLQRKQAERLEAAAVNQDEAPSDVNSPDRSHDAGR
jgi:hypothetical protein